MLYQLSYAHHAAPSSRGSFGNLTIISQSCGERTIEKHLTHNRAGSLVHVLFFVGVIGLNLYAIALVILRAVVYRVTLYRPMLWNVFLSMVPIFVLLLGLLAGAIATQVAPAAGTAVWIATMLIWLLMLPNASYLITELNFSHRGDDDPVPLWYDIVLVISLAMSGVVNTVVNVLVVHVMAAIMVFGDSMAAITRPASWIAVGVVLLLLGFGMYLGRYLRLNSWDIKHPIGFLRRIVEHFSAWERVWACVGFTLTYAAFLGFIYLIIGGMYIDTLSTLEASKGSL